VIFISNERNQIVNAGTKRTKEHPKHSLNRRRLRPLCERCFPARLKPGKWPKLRPRRWRFWLEVYALTPLLSPESRWPHQQQSLRPFPPRAVRKKKMPPLVREATNSPNLTRISATGIDWFLSFPVEGESKISNEAYWRIGNIEEKLYEKRGEVTKR